MDVFIIILRITRSAYLPLSIAARESSASNKVLLRGDVYKFLRLEKKIFLHHEKKNFFSSPILEYCGSLRFSQPSVSCDTQNSESIFSRVIGHRLSANGRLCCDMVLIFRNEDFELVMAANAISIIDLRCTGNLGLFYCDEHKNWDEN